MSFFISKDMVFFEFVFQFQNPKAIPSPISLINIHSSIFDKLVPHIYDQPAPLDLLPPNVGDAFTSNLVTMQNDNVSAETDPHHEDMYVKSHIEALEYF